MAYQEYKITLPDISLLPIKSHLRISIFWLRHKYLYSKLVNTDCFSVNFQFSVLTMALYNLVISRFVHQAHCGFCSVCDQINHHSSGFARPDRVTPILEKYLIVTLICVSML